jgi:integrase/recombinase XerD
MRSPFSLFPRVRPATGLRYWYAKYWSEEAGRYTRTRSLGIPYAGRHGGRDLAAKAAQGILAEVNRDSDPFILGFIAAFWAPDSPHVKARALVDRRPLSLDYLEHNRRALRLHLEPFPGFRGLRLSKLRAGIVKDWQLWALEHGATPRACNYALQALRVPVREAVARGDIPADPLAIVKKVPETPKERGILGPREIEALIRAPEADPRIRAAVFLAALAGLRRGELRGLRWGDIDKARGLVYIRHNAVDFEKDKVPKTGSARTVPLHEAAADAVDEVRRIAPFTAADDFVFFSLQRRGMPLTGRAFLDGFRRMLCAIGIDEDERRRRNLNLHALRHSFITLARSLGMPDVSVMALSGHKSPEMLTRYSHGAQVLDFNAARESFERAVSSKVASGA